MTAATVIGIGQNGLKQDPLLSQVHTIMDKAAEHLKPIIENFATAALKDQKTLVELSELLKQATLPIMGAILQDTLQKVADNQSLESSCPRCQNPTRGSRKRPRKFDTLHGPVEISRRYFHCKTCKIGFSPLDEKLRLSASRKQEDVQKGALAIAAELPFHTASQLYEQLTGLSFSDHAMHDLVAAHGGSAEVASILPLKNDIDEIISEHTTPGKWRPILVISADGAHAPTRGAETCSRNEKRGSGEWREVKGFRAYIAKHDRIVQIASWHRICDESEFGEALDELGKIVDPNLVRIAAVADGAPWIWKHIERVFPTAKQALDYYHCKQHLHTLAKLQYRDDQGQQTEWVESIITRLFFDEIESVIWGLQRIKTPTTEAAEEARKLINYLNENKGRLNYGSLRRSQAPLGSGGIESSNKQLCQVRLKRPGAWWNVEGANAILAVRCAKLNQTLPQLMAASRAPKVEFVSKS